MNIDDLLTLVPEHWHPYLLLFFLCASGGSALLKLVLGDPRPGDSMLRRCAFGLAQVLDWAAINSETVRAKLKRMRAELAARDEAEIAEAQRQAERTPTNLSSAIDHYNLTTLLQEAEANAMARLEAGAPPDIVEQDRFRREMALRRMTPAERKNEREELVAMRSKVDGNNVRALVVLALLSLSTQACAHQANVARHGTALKALEYPLLEAKGMIEARMFADDAAVRARVSDEQAQKVELDALAEHYAPITAAANALFAAYDAYIDAVHEARETGARIPASLALALLSKWRALVDVARQLGIPLPDPPDVPREIGALP